MLGEGIQPGSPPAAVSAARAERALDSSSLTQPGSPPAAVSAAAPADNPERADVLTSRDGLVLDAEAQATWEKLLDRPPRELP